MLCGINNDPYIKIYENALSNELCDSIIKIFEENQEDHIDGVTGGGLNKNSKVTREMYFNREPLNMYDESLYKNLNHYLKKYSMENNIEIMMSNNIDDTGYQLQKYIAKEGFYKWHEDSAFEKKK